MLQLQNNLTPTRGMLKKAVNLRQGYGRQASGIPWLCLSGSHRHGRHFSAFGLTDLPLFVTFALTYGAHAPRVKPTPPK